MEEPAKKPEKESCDKYGRGKTDYIDPGEDGPEYLWFNTMVKQLLEKEQRVIKLKEQGKKLESLLDEVSFEGIVKYIRDEKCSKIITLSGAGISTAAKIPDFRSEDSDLFQKIKDDEKFKILPSSRPPMTIFDLNFFKEHPEPFYVLAKELFPRRREFKPTLAHWFIRLLQDKNLLLRHYTQNVDNLERAAGIRDELLVQAHGSFNSTHCLDCKAEYSLDNIEATVMSGEVPRCVQPKTEGSAELCGGIIKPDVIFFGEELEERFYTRMMQDFPLCDLIIIMGTSLEVQPFGSLPDRVPEDVPRLYINRRTSEGGDDPVAVILGLDHGFKFDQKENIRDVFEKGDCDDGCRKLAAALGWEAELNALMRKAEVRTSVYERRA